MFNIQPMTLAARKRELILKAMDNMGQSAAESYVAQNINRDDLEKVHIPAIATIFAAIDTDNGKGASERRFSMVKNEVNQRIELLETEKDA